MPPRLGSRRHLALAAEPCSAASLERGAAPLRTNSSLPSRKALDKSGPKPDPERVQDAIAILQAPVPACPHFGGVWHVNEESGHARPTRCMGRHCSSCSRLLAIEDGYRIARGIHELRERGLRIRFVTLTDGAAAALDSKALGAAWGRFSSRLRRRGKLGPYVKVVEVQERGALHLHVLIAADDDGYIPQGELSELAQASGFGPIADVRELRGEEGVASIAAYLTKPPAEASAMAERARSISSYLVKQGATAEHAEYARERFGRRARPVNFSLSWPAPIQAETRQEIRAHFREQAIEAGTEIVGEWRTVTELQTVLCLPVLREALQIMAARGQEPAERFQTVRGSQRPAAARQGARGPPGAVAA